MRLADGQTRCNDAAIYQEPEKAGRHAVGLRLNSNRDRHRPSPEGNLWARADEPHAARGHMLRSDRVQIAPGFMTISP